MQGMTDLVRDARKGAERAKVRERLLGCGVAEIALGDFDEQLSLVLGDERDLLSPLSPAH
jgi:hypothetical protein